MASPGCAWATRDERSEDRLQRQQDSIALNERDLNAALNLEQTGFQFPGPDVEAA